MNSFPTREELLAKYPPGTVVELTAHMRDPYEKRLTTGSKALITGADDFENLLCRWDNGSTLNIVPGDEFKIVGNFTDKIRQNLLSIRDSGVTNMFSALRLKKDGIQLSIFSKPAAIFTHGGYSRVNNSPHI